MAAENGSDTADFKLAELYDHGKGIDHDIDRAVDQMISAVRAGEPASMESLLGSWNRWSLAFRQGLQSKLKGDGAYQGDTSGVMTAAFTAALKAIYGVDE